MFEIGISLRQARQHRSWEIADAERETRIRAKYLTALEEERFDALPGVAYVRGFLRTYAEFLGLDGNLVIDEFNARFAPPEDELPPIQPRGLAVRGRPLGQPLIGVGAVAMTFAVIAVWQLGFTSAERTPIPQASAAAVPVAHRAAKPKRQAAPKPAARPKRAAVVTPGTLVVHAVKGDCWVAVRRGGANGPLVYERIVRKGGIVRFGLAKPLWVRLGAAWNTDITLRGKRLPAFGRRLVNLRVG
jgi:cytoskeleton protein RodZ